MSGRGKYRGKRHNNHYTSDVARDTANSQPTDSLVLNMFKSMSLKLNDRQDRHERLVKLSRDITIESKRVIFLLHSAITEESAEKAVKEANERLQKLISGPIKNIALELENSPAYLHSRAVTNGFQEFVEARTFCSLMEKKHIITWADMQKELTYEIKDDSEDENARTAVALLINNDYMLGIADLTGELMRKAINSISSGDSKECFDSCKVVRVLYTGFLGLFGGGKELGRKMTTTRNNVSKVESAVYALQVRGGEAPPTLLLPTKPDWELREHYDDDEGFF